MKPRDIDEGFVLVEEHSPFRLEFFFGFIKLVEDSTTLLGNGRNQLRSTHRHKPGDWNRELRSFGKLDNSQIQQIVLPVVYVKFNCVFL
jgi:hypothetical protein